MPFCITVSELNAYLKNVADSDDMLRQILVKGEVFNFTRHFKTGHLYFSLKEGNSSIKCVMFSFNAVKLRVGLADGMEVTVFGRVSVYERDGCCQIVAESVSPGKEGVINKDKELLFERLNAEGVFDPAKKLPLPRFPEKIAVLTSDSGAVIKDILSVWARRWPLCEIVRIPVSVQGADAAADIAEKLSLLSFSVADAAILARGGGSAEDLWVFNDEAVVRAVAGCAIPVISAIGHETDFTLCDFAAAVRAATPTAAAEIAMPSAEAVFADVERLYLSICGAASDLADSASDRLDAYGEAALSGLAEAFLCSRRELCDRREELIVNGFSGVFNRFSAAFSKNLALLDSLSPSATLARGFCAVKKDGFAVARADLLSAGDMIDLTFADGSRHCEVLK